MITVDEVRRKYYECDSCAESEASTGVKIKQVSIKSHDGNHATSFKLCKKCFEGLKIKF